MKKAYKAPKYKTINLTGEILMQTSDPTDTYDEVIDPTDALVKGQSRGSLWDDEW